MGRHFNRVTAVLLLAICGCASGPFTKSTTVVKQVDTVNGTKLKQGENSFRQSWEKFVKPKAVDADVATWDWIPAIPAGAPRAELLSPTLPVQALASYVPGRYNSEIRQVSTFEKPPLFQLIEVNGQPIKDCGQLYTAVEQVLAVGEPANVRFENAESSTLPVEIPPMTLAALSQAVVPEIEVMRVVIDGKSLTLIRQGGVRCTVSAQLERETGLVHVVMSLAVYDGTQIMLPVEIRANFNDQPLRCLTVADTLGFLYANGRKTSPSLDESACSFAAVSERDDYLLPTNYKQLQKLNENPEDSLRARQQPALAVVPGQIYPAPALLGDARALTEFMLQRQLYQPGEVEHTGWVIFAADDLGDGGTLNLALDLGQGPQLISFVVPTS